MSTKRNHYRVICGSTISIDTYGTEKGCEKEFNKKLKILNTVAKALGLELWTDEVLVEE